MATNPYQPPKLPAQLNPEGEQPAAERRTRDYIAAAAVGAVVAVVTSIPLAGCIGFLFRFPVPFAGLASGPAAFIPAMVAALFYGAMGGVVVQAVAGGLAGALSFRYWGRQGSPAALPIVLGGALGALPGLLLLATLDWIIGPW